MTMILLTGHSSVKSGNEARLEFEAKRLDSGDGEQGLPVKLSPL